MASSSYSMGFAALQGLMGIAQGMSQKGAYDIQAKQAGLDAKAAELQRRRELQDALAMQAVIAGAGGRATGEGSFKTLQQADIKRAGEDVEMIKAGGKAKQASLTGAGRMARASSITSGLLSASKTLYSTEQVK